MKLYDWQVSCLKSWEDHSFRGIVHVVTGAGKTVLALSAMERLRERWPDLVVRVVVPTIPLAAQWNRELLHSAPDDAWRPGFFGGGTQDHPDRRVMIYVINSARNALSGHIRRDLAMKRRVLLICDECHHYQSAQNRRIFGFVTDEVLAGEQYMCLGLSATPFGIGDDGVLRRGLGEVICRYGFEQAVADGVISPFAICEVSASFLGEELAEYNRLSEQIGIILRKLLEAYPYLEKLAKMEFIKAVTAIAREADMDPEDPAAAFLLLTYQRKELSNLAKTRIRCGISILERLDEKDRVLVFCERIAQAEDMAAALRRKGKSCGIYHSEMTGDARRRVLREFREGSFRILLSCRCLDEGIDVPDANIGIVLSNSAVDRQRIQRLGRLVRRSPGKDTACLYYIYIRESSDDAAYLPELSGCETFPLRYYTAEDAFASELYEYVAAALIRRAKRQGYTEEELRELRRCLEEGLTRADFLLAADKQAAQVERAASVHEKNYWKMMQKTGALFRSEQEMPDEETAIQTSEGKEIYYVRV